MKRILITGSNGLLGQKLVHQLLQNESYVLLATSMGENRMSILKEANYSKFDHFSSVSIYLRERNATGTSYYISFIWFAATKPTPSHADG